MIVTMKMWSMCKTKKTEGDRQQTGEQDLDVCRRPQKEVFLANIITVINIPPNSGRRKFHGIYYNFTGISVYFLVNIITWTQIMTYISLHIIVTYQEIMKMSPQAIWSGLHQRPGGRFGKEVRFYFVLGSICCCFLFTFSSSLCSYDVTSKKPW